MRLERAALATLHGGVLRALKGWVLLACLAICGLARAQPVPPQGVDLRVPRDPTPLLLRSTLVGGAAGLAVGGSVLGVMSAVGRAPQDWGPVLATGAGLGLVIGLAWGMMGPDSTPAPALLLRPWQDGFGYADQHQSDRSGRVMLPMFGQHF